VSDTLYYPNRFVHDLFRAMEEVMGQHGLEEALAKAHLTQPPPDDLAREFPFERIAALNNALDQLYGTRGGRGMALRAGRAWFAKGMKGFGALGGAADPAFRMLAREDRVRLALQAQAEIFTRFSDQRSRLETAPNTHRFIAEASPFAYGCSAEKPICHPLVGLLQECVRWASNGRSYTVRETHCIAAGETACIVVINH
jgi:predicted hydrocarbon binding protein